MPCMPTPDGPACSVRTRAPWRRCNQALLPLAWQLLCSRPPKASCAAGCVRHAGWEPGPWHGCHCRCPCPTSRNVRCTCLPRQSFAVVFLRPDHCHKSRSCIRCSLSSAKGRHACCTSAAPALKCASNGMQWPAHVGGPDEAWEMLNDDTEQPQQPYQAVSRRWGRLAIRLRCQRGQMSDEPDGGDESAEGGSHVICGG
jgi:hypothetical protein